MNSIENIRSLYHNLDVKDYDTFVSQYLLDKTDNEEFYENREKNMLEFDERIISEIHDGNTLEDNIKFASIVQNNIIDFLQSRYSRTNKEDLKEFYRRRCSDILEKVHIALMDQVYKSGFSLIPPFSENKNIGQEIEAIDEIRDSVTYFMSIKYPQDSDDFLDVKIFDYLPDTMDNERFVVPFCLILRKLYPYFYRESSSDEELLSDLIYVMEKKNEKNFGFARISTEFISHDLFLKLIHTIKNAFHHVFSPNLDIIISSHSIFDYNQLKNRLKKENMNTSFTIRKQTKTQPTTMMVNVDQANLYPGILFETPFVSYDSVFYLIHRECFNSHAIEYATKWPNQKVPDTMSIFMTIYRADPKSELIDQLVHAAKHDIKVFVFIEPNARDSEKENMETVKRLRKAGCHVTVSYFGMKVHAKMFLSIRTDGSTVAHISTGNYDLRRTATFTDYQFITQDSSICDEVLHLFNMIIQQQPIMMNCEYFLSEERTIFFFLFSIRHTLINECDTKVCQRILMKCNNLTDPLMKSELYKAVERGITIKGLCRTSCTLVPFGKKIQIRSNIGKYLEHGRMYCFDDRTYISSADLLFRNLNKRVELMVRIPDNVPILSKWGVDRYLDACKTHDQIASEMIYETPENYLTRCFLEAKWIKSEEDFHYRKNKK